MHKIAEVVLPLKEISTLLYVIPEGLDVKEGMLVDVPLREGTSRGVIIRIKEEEKIDFELKEILGIPDRELVIDKNLLSLASWLSLYYFSPLGKVLSLFFPPGVFVIEKKEVRVKGDINIAQVPEGLREIVDYLMERRGWVKISTLEKKFGGNTRSRIRRLETLGFVETREKLARRKPRAVTKFIKEEVEISIPVKPNFEQEIALKRIIPFLRDSKHGVFLLYGVTGSGKTAVYMWLVEEVLRMGKSALLLVPEIGLTQEVIRVFYEMFGELVTLYHSSFTPSERYAIWREVKEGRRKIVIGPRSALFLPLMDPGIIIVDEEHETAYKQSETEPYYNARDVAIVRAKLTNIPVVLGSATPSLESYYNAKKGKYHLIKLKRRVKGYSPPKFEVVDMRKETTSLSLSIRLIERIREVLSEGKQVILFINRRGYAPHLQCASCGHIEKCPRCSVTLVYHKKEKLLKCHICGFSKEAPSVCPKCGSLNLVTGGVGTERVEEEVKTLFKDAGIDRMDLDTTRRKGAHERIYTNFKKGRIKILIGTQMVGKGFDFPRVDLVGVVSADVALNIPDFRAEERNFQLLTQVAGRVRKGGRVVVQTRLPDSASIVYTIKRDYVSFAENELKERELYGYPPFKRIAVLEVRGRDRDMVINFIKSLYDVIHGVEKEGPAPAPIEKVKNEYRWRILLKSERTLGIQEALSSLSISIPKGLKLRIDVDPLELL